VFGDGASLQLPRGLYDDGGACHREAVLRPLTGHEELALAERGGARIDPAAASALFASCLGRIGGYAEVLPEHAAALTRGDRQHLALHLRARMFGDRLSLVVPCPNPGCRELADLDLSVRSLLLDPARVVPEVLEADTPDGRARLREPTGADDEIVARAPGDHRERAALLWSRLVLDLGGRGRLSSNDWTALSPATRGAIALALAEQGGALDLAVLAPCPSCRALLELEIDPLELVARELAAGVPRLYAEIHAVAWHYHWAEADILALPRARRWRYLELISRQVEGRPLVGEWGSS
jgi:hypothetical protein